MASLPRCTDGLGRIPFPERRITPHGGSVRHFVEAAPRPTVVPVQLEIGPAKFEVGSAQVEKKLLLLSDLYSR